MSREILVATPENIEIEYELAGIGTRVLASALDTLWQILLFTGVGLAVVIILLLVNITGAVWAHDLVEFANGAVQALAVIGFFLVFWGYFIWFEYRWNGQTPGKRALGLRVVRDGGYPVNSYSVIVRNLLRIADGSMPLVAAGLVIAGAIANATGSSLLNGVGAAGGFYILVALSFMLGSARYQRLGDFVAGTMVIKQRAPRVPTLEALAPPPRVMPEHLAPFVLADIARHVYEMTVPEYRAVRHSIDRRWQLPANVQQTAAMFLAVPLMRRLGISSPPGILRINYADFLEYLAVAFEQYRGVK